MVQNQNTGLSTETRALLIDAEVRLMRLVHEAIPPEPTEFGESLRALADRVDYAPALWTAVYTPNQPAKVSVLLTNGDAVHTIAADLGATVTEAHTIQEVITSADLDMGLVELHLFAYDEEPREVRRPTDVTPTIEAVES